MSKEDERDVIVLHISQIIIVLRKSKVLIWKFSLTLPNKTMAGD